MKDLCYNCDKNFVPRNICMIQRLFVIDGDWIDNPSEL